MLDDIDYIIKYRPGGYTFEMLYTCPIWLRRYIKQKISEENRKHNQEVEKAKGQEQLSFKTMQENKKKLFQQEKPYVTNRAKK